MMGNQIVTGLGDLITTIKNLVLSANTINQTIARVFPQAIATATSATAGAETLPANPAGFLVVVNPVTGTSVKIPYYNT